MHTFVFETHSLLTDEIACFERKMVEKVSFRPIIMAHLAGVVASKGSVIAIEDNRVSELLFLPGNKQKNHAFCVVLAMAHLAGVEPAHTESESDALSN